MGNDLQVACLEKRWGDFTAVDRVSFTVAESTLCVLLGPSGCGKSTILRMIAGLEEASGGSIYIAGRDVTTIDPARRGVSMVFQSYALFPHLSVGENIVFGLKVRKVSATERAARLRQAAELVGLAELLERKPAQLSGGQQQRVALARAIVSQQPVCLMDEPLSNLDAKLRSEMRSEIRALQKRLGLTMVYVTHDQIEAMTMADQVILLKDGRVEQSGPPHELYERPATAFTAGFIGAPPMNLLLLDELPNLNEIKAATDDMNLPRVTTGMRYGVRPEDIELAEDGLSARVEAVDFLGAGSIITLRHQNQQLLASCSGRAALTIGQQVYLRWSPEAVHLFSANGRTEAEESIHP